MEFLKVFPLFVVPKQNRKKKGMKKKRKFFGVSANPKKFT